MPEKCFYSVSTLYHFDLDEGAPKCVCCSSVMLTLAITNCLVHTEQRWLTFTWKSNYRDTPSHQTASRSLTDVLAAIRSRSDLKALSKSRHQVADSYDKKKQEIASSSSTNGALRCTTIRDMVILTPSGRRSCVNVLRFVTFSVHELKIDKPKIHSTLLYSHTYFSS